MRRSILLAGITTGVLVLAGAVALTPARSAQGRIKSHVNKIKDVAFCQKGYEIASSFPHYAASRTPDMATRVALLRRSDQLEAQREHLGRMLRGVFKAEALDLGLGSFEYDALLAQLESQAEKDAAVSFQSTSKPSEFLAKLDDICQPYLS